MLFGIMFPSNMLPGIFQYIGKIFPATWDYIIGFFEKYHKKVVCKKPLTVGNVPMAKAFARITILL